MIGKENEGIGLFYVNSTIKNTVYRVFNVEGITR